MADLGKLQGHRVKLRREKMGYTQGELGELLGVEGRQIIRYEKPNANPSALVVVQLATALRTSSDYLLGLSDDPTPKDIAQELTAEERALIEKLIEQEDVTAALNALHDTAETPDPTADLERQIAALEEEGRRLIQKQLRAPTSVSDLYDEQIHLLGERLEIVQARLAAHQRQTASPIELAEQQRAFAEIHALHAAFWELPPRELNQLLRRALGRRVFGVLDGKIVRVRRLS